MADYIYVKTQGGSDLTGWKLNVSLVNNFDFQKGIDSIDLSIPNTSSELRTLLFTSGLKEDYDFTFELIDDGVNKAFAVDNVGNETPQNIISTEGQLTFLLDKIMSKNLKATYIINVDWPGRTLSGFLRIRGNVTDDFFTRVQFSATLKVGVNVL